MFRFCIMLTSAALLVAGFMISGAAGAAPRVVGGDQGWYTVHCNQDGATVYFDTDYKGQTQAGELNVPVYSTGTPYKTFTVSKEGYSPFTDTLPVVPSKGEAIDLYATLNPVVPTTPAMIGGEQAWFTVHCNVNGAQVSFDGDVKGLITQGTLTVPVYTTGTPYRTYSVWMNGYVPYTATIEQYPAKGQTIDLYATLNPVSPTTVPPTAPPTTKSPVSAITVLVGLGVGGIAAIFAAVKKN